MRSKLLGLAVLATTGCSGSGAEDSDADPRPTACDLSALAGTYLRSYQYVSGDCSAPDATLVRFGDPPTDGGCEDSAEPRYSEGGCAVEEEFTCTDASGNTAEFTTIVRQDTADGSRLSGLLSVDLDDASGNQICSGTFRVTFVRQ